MELKLVRKYLKSEYTIGHLYINGKFYCDVLEDKVRDTNKDGDLNDVGETKVYGHTAIPYGRYRVSVKVRSPKFSLRPEYLWCAGYLPRLLDVPHFDGILIHSGSTAEHTEGCLLVGENKMKGQLINSMATLRKLYAELKLADSKGEEIWISIE